MDRRSAVAGLLVAASSILAASPAQAFLGIGEGPNIEQYQKETVRKLQTRPAVLYVIMP